ncbi:ImmA/IrrE family metallo-endopeptidase [Photobacterium leiognathi]|uniref:ImmA/IrrE family metallo-endopeptidase n=1 Tax=Photobacterium leiognathi TaxID=553611 RepID=UPI00298167D6|nr:M12 family metallo-peptidase [Photobacterium leiognathi]
MKKSLVLGLLASTVALSVNATDLSSGLGVELIVSDGFKSKPESSLYAVSHFNNVTSANAVYKANGLDINIYADKIVYENYDDSLDTSRLNSEMIAKREQFAWQSKPFLSVVISQKDSNVFGASTQPHGDAEFDPDGVPLYQMGQHRYITLNKATMYGAEKTDNNYYTFAHELGHALGALHEASDDDHAHSVEDEYYANAVAATTCLDGSKPLMIANAEFYSKLPLITGSDKCPLLDKTKNPNGEVMQRYYNSTQQDGYTMLERTPSTLSLAVTENINSQQFDFTVTRTGKSAESGTLFIAGNGIGLTPIDFSLAENETSKTISVDFTKLHELMTTSDNNYQNGSDIENTVYAVAQTASEVVKGAINVSDANTQWKSVPKDNEPEPQPEPQPDNGGSGGGGSSTLGFLMMLAALAWYRKK